MLLRIAGYQSMKAVGTAARWTARAALAPFAWAYDAISPTNKRQSPSGVLRSEDAELTQSQRGKLVSGGRDLHRNFALLGWAIRKHLDYVSTFTFQAKGEREDARRKIEAFVKKWSRPENFDIAGRHGLERFIRMGEESRVTDGDFFIAKLNTGHVQAIEGDRVRNQLGKGFDWQTNDRLIHGVLVNEYGRAMKYSVNRRGGTGQLSTGSTTFVFERWLDAGDVIHHAYFTRFDQVRGVSPLAPVYNGLRDLYEAFDYALAKMKVSQLLGLIVYSDATNAMETEENEVPEGNDLDDDDSEAVPKYAVNFGKSTFKLELEGKDRAEFIESKSPSAEFQSFTQTMVALVLKAFDIPYSFYAEDFSNYSGSRQALLQYEQSAEQRRKDNREVLNNLTSWRLRKALEENDPDLDGVTEEDLVWEWVAASLPWIDPLKETTANAAGVDRGFTCVPDVCKEQGKDAIDIATRQANYERDVIKIRTERGLPGVPSASPITYTEVSNNVASDSTAA
jgi:capsid protein